VFPLLLFYCLIYYLVAVIIFGIVVVTYSHYIHLASATGVTWIYDQVQNYENSKKEMVYLKIKDVVQIVYWTLNGK